VTEEDDKVLTRRALTADVFFLAAGVLATTAVVLGINTNWESDPEDAQPPDKQSRLRVQEMAVAPTSSGALLSVGGSF
jgi:hypothetical protein